MLERIVKMANQLRDAESDVERLSQELKDAKARAERISTESLPALMTEAGLSEIKLEDGSKVTVSEEVKASITEKNRPAAVRWLTERGYDGIVKTELKLAFARDERDEAKAVAEQLRGDHPAVELKETVHPQTLKSFIKERMEAGEEVPFDLFGIHPYSKATIKR